MDETTRTDGAYYVIRGGVEGRERLRILARVMEPTTRALLERVGIGTGMTCLDVGCGGGDVTALLAAAVGSDGQVLGIDIDPTTVDLARREAAAAQLGQVTFRVADETAWGALAGYDVAYARFVLTHVPDPLALLRRMRAAVRSGGMIVLEDIDFRGHFCHPESSAFGRYVELYTRVVQRRGGDPNIGPRLPELLTEIGCECVRLHVVQPAAMDGEAKLIAPLTMENTAAAMVEQGLAGGDEIARIVAELHAIARDGRSVMSLPRVVQAWGQTLG
jgi:SAM-dependent methyltransferase